MKQWLKTALLGLFSIMLGLGLNYYLDFLPLNYNLLSEKLKIDLTQPHQAKVEADFSFENFTRIKRSITLFYPFYLKKGHFYPKNLKVHLNGKPWKWENAPGGVLVTLNFKPRQKLQLELGFTQEYRGDFYKLIAGYSRGWLQPIRKGEIMVLPGKTPISRITPEMNRTEEPQDGFYWLKRDNYYDEGVTIQFGR